MRLLQTASDADKARAAGHMGEFQGEVADVFGDMTGLTPVLDRQALIFAMGSHQIRYVDGHRAVEVDRDETKFPGLFQPPQVVEQ